MDTYINTTTGEIVSKQDIKEMFYEDQVVKQANQKKGIAIKKKKDEFAECVDFNLGSFTFTRYKRLFTKINNDFTLAFRFIYLCTYADYDGLLKFGDVKNGVHHAYMTENDLQEVFELGERASRDLKNTLFEKELIKKDNKGKLWINPYYISRGTQTKIELRNATRTFDIGIQELYKSVTARQHKQVGLLFALLPYIHKDFNIVCKTTDEKNAEYIKHLNLEEIAELLGYSKENQRRLKKDLLSIEIMGECVFMGIETKYGYTFATNPRIYYAGNNVEDLKWLFGAFRICKK